MVFRGQKYAFLAFQNFFPKIKVKSGKNEKLAKNSEKGPKMDFFGFPTLFATIFITQAQQTGQKSHFQPFWAIFGHFWCTPFEVKNRWHRTRQIAIFLPNLVD